MISTSHSDPCGVNVLKKKPLSSVSLTFTTFWITGQKEGKDQKGLEGVNEVEL